MLAVTPSDTRHSALDAVRAHFPALARRHHDLPVAYFDGPGGTQVPRAVVDAMTHYLYHHNANTHWAYPSSAETDLVVERARGAFADFFNGRPDEIVFGANMTTLTFHVARALGRALGPGDEIVVTELDHHANVAPWRALERERGVTVRVARMRPESGTLDWTHFAEQLNARTRLVAVGAASNALGTITDVRQAAEIAHAVGALVFVDAVHYAPHELVDVQALECDFLACSPYKFYGPHLGVLWGRHALLQTVDAPKLDPAPDDAPERLETGTQSFESIAGAAAAVDFIASLGTADAAAPRRERLASAYAAMHERDGALVAALWGGLADTPGVTLYGLPHGQARTGTVAFTVAGHPSRGVAEALARRAVFASHGDFYAATVAARLGHAADGLVRAGTACYTTMEEIERLVAGVRALAVG